MRNYLLEAQEELIQGNVAAAIVNLRHCLTLARAGYGNSDGHKRRAIGAHCVQAIEALGYHV